MDFEVMKAYLPRVWDALLHQCQGNALPADAKRQQQRVPEPWQIGFHDLKIHKHPPVSA